MIYWSLFFFVVAIAAGILGFTGVAGLAAEVAAAMLFAALILALVFLLVDRKPPRL